MKVEPFTNDIACRHGGGGATAGHAFRSGGFVVAISGPSGIGKTTVSNEAIRRMDGIVRSISLNTRPRRNEEEDGVDYYFVSNEEFDSQLNAGNLIEYVEIYGHRRGTPKNMLLNNMKNCTDTICAIEWNGVRKLWNEVGPENVVSVFLLPPTLDALKERITLRAQDSAAEIERRLCAAEQELANAVNYNYIVVNDDFLTCVSCIIGIITAERSKSCRLRSDELLASLSRLK
jgi:guanylate kinase